MFIGISICTALFMVPMFSSAAVARGASEENVTPVMAGASDATEVEATVVETEQTTYMSAPDEPELYQVTIPAGSATAEEERRKGEEFLARMEEERLEQEAHDALIAEYFDEDDVVMMAQLINVEAGAVYPLYRRAAVGWTVLNRLESGRWGPTSISGIITQDDQYAWYAGASYSELDYEIARDVLTRWAEEQISGDEDPGRVLPKQYESFYGDGSQNYFYDQYGNYWNFEIEMDPYENW